MNDLISRQAAIDALKANRMLPLGDHPAYNRAMVDSEKVIRNLSSAQPTLYGYNIEHLEMIAIVLQKENLSPERVAEVLTDISRIVAIVVDEFEETLRKSVNQCIERPFHNINIRAERRQEWTKGINENGVTTSLFCSECNYENKHWYEWNYCPNCGADMRGKQDESN